ncbi:hypothetical protein [Nocardia sp. NPDC060259]|uniref:DUF7373 family lipoprotein n=1 Tax=Nocardia sp. NPDC060259 TaxID=3347088 RepID=UPI0036568E0C
MRKIRAYSAVVALTIALSACGGGPDAATPAAPEVDITKLDSGNYPTKPDDMEANRHPAAGALRESIKIGAASPTPYDFDNRFIYVKQKGGRHVTADNPPYYSGTGFENAKEALAVIPGVVAGWKTSAQRRDEFDAGRGVGTMVVRFSNGDQSRFAYEELAKRTEGNPDQIPGYPDAHVRVAIKKSSYTTQYMRAWLVRGDLLIYIHLSDPVSIPFDGPANAEIVKKYFDKQLEMLKSYSPTPLAEIDKQPIDVDGLLAHTLPSESGKNDGAAVYPTQALLHTARRLDKLSLALADAGVDYTSVDLGTVFRARDSAAAVRYMAAEEADATTPKHIKVDGPPNMPGAHCYNAKPEAKYASDAPPICLTVVGRYVIKSYSTNLQDAYQRLAAQYKLLAGYS